MLFSREVDEGGKDVERFFEELHFIDIEHHGKHLRKHRLDHLEKLCVSSVLRKRLKDRLDGEQALYCCQRRFFIVLPSTGCSQIR